jgi:methyl-accepting chemotaxis protein
VRGLTIGTKLITSFLSLAAASALVGGVGLAVTRALTTELQDLSWGRIPMLLALARAQDGFARVRAFTSEALAAGLQRDDAAVLAAWQERERARANALQGAAKVGENDLSPEEAELWRRVEPALQAFLAANGDVWSALRGHELGRAAALQASLAPRAEAELVHPLEQLVELEARTADRLMIAADDTAERTRRTLWAVVALTFGAAAALGLLLTRHLTRPLRALRDVAVRVADGDLTLDVAIEGQDEVGVLARQFRVMVVRLREIVATLKAASGELGTEAERLSGHARAQSALLERQASAVAETTTTAHQLEQASSLAAGRAADVLQVAQRAAAVSDRGRSDAERSVAELVHLQGAVEGLSGQSLHLADRARQMGDIVETVRDLATQSHVLSLNASIEAVRAGAAGKSFAVVAQEVRALAQQSGEGAARIAGMLQEIQGAAAASRDVTRRETEGMNDSLARIRASGESLREIGHIVRDTSDAAVQIAAAVQQQSAGIAQISVAMRDLNGGMGDAVARIRELEESAQQVAGTAARIAEISGQFRIGAGPDPAAA